MSTPLAGPVGPGWRLFVASTVTGQIVGDVPFSGTPSWDSGINVTGRLEVQVPLGGGSAAEGGIAKTDLWPYLDYWRWSWGLAYDAYICQCGPLVTYQFSDEAGPPTVRIGCTGLWGLFTNKRLLINPAWTAGTPITDTSADTVLTDLTLHSIARRLVSNDLTRNGSLPIVLPAEITGTETRTYPGYDLANVGERMQQLTQVINGPEIEFRPEYTDSTRRAVRWPMRIGNPRLGNLGLPHAFDYGRALTHLDIDADGSAQQFDTWVRGNGTERGLLTGRYTDTSLVAAGWPNLENVDNNHTSDIEPATMNGWAQADVQTYRTGMSLASATVRVDGSDGRGDQLSRSPSLDLIAAGDTATFTITGHRFVRDGTYAHRILGISSAQGLPYANLKLQEVPAQ